ncbi:hypothetical protein PFISCL1PPCAC_268, partial [Pristionchus fissidentatus]
LTSPLLSSLQFPSTMRLQIVAMILFIAMFSGTSSTLSTDHRSIVEILAELDNTGTGALGKMAAKEKETSTQGSKSVQVINYLAVEKSGNKDKMRTQYKDLFCDVLNPNVTRLGSELIYADDSSGPFRRIEDEMNRLFFRHEYKSCRENGEKSEGVIECTCKDNGGASATTMCAIKHKAQELIDNGTITCSSSTSPASSLTPHSSLMLLKGPGTA